MQNRFQYHLTRIRQEQKQQQQYNERLRYALRRGLSPSTKAALAQLDAEEEAEERAAQRKREQKALARIDRMAAEVTAQERWRTEVMTVANLEKQHEQTGWMDSEIARDAVLQKAREERAAQLARLAPRR